MWLRLRLWLWLLSARLRLLLRATRLLSSSLRPLGIWTLLPRMGIWAALLRLARWLPPLVAEGLARCGALPPSVAALPKRCPYTAHLREPRGEPHARRRVQARAPDGRCRQLSLTCTGRGTFTRAAGGDRLGNRLRQPGPAAARCPRFVGCGPGPRGHR